MKEKKTLKFRTVCAWCDRLISEKECPETENRLALAQNGVIISHGICDKCRKKLDKQDKIKH